MHVDKLLELFNSLFIKITVIIEYISLISHEKNIYIGHSNRLDYERELYKPIRKSNLNDEYRIVLPREETKKPYNSKKLFNRCDFFIAEVFYPSTGLGIEIGWASMLEVPIICMYKKGMYVSRSLRVVTENLIEYKDASDMISKLSLDLKKLI